jgi:hypothetical protein
VKKPRKKAQAREFDLPGLEADQSVKAIPFSQIDGLVLGGGPDDIHRPTSDRRWNGQALHRSRKGYF